MNLADEVEDLFIKHFAEEDRRKGMKYLRPRQRKESHAVTFFIGEFLATFAKGLITKKVFLQKRNTSNKTLKMIF